MLDQWQNKSSQIWISSMEIVHSDWMINWIVFWVFFFFVKWFYYSMNCFYSIINICRLFFTLSPIQYNRISLILIYFAHISGKQLIADSQNAIWTNPTTGIRLIDFVIFMQWKHSYCRSWSIYLGKESENVQLMTSDFSLEALKNSAFRNQWYSHHKNNFWYQEIEIAEQ